MGAVFWFIAAVILAGLELMAGEFTMLMLAGGAAAGGVAALLGAPLWASIAAFAIASVGLILFLRPVLRRRLQSPLVLDTSTNALVGQSAEVLDPVGPQAGQIRLDGSIWSARTVADAPEIPAGESVVVVRIDGATAIVWKEP